MMKNKKARADILQAIIRHSGEANTTQIRTETGISRNRMNYWYRTLAEENLIEIEHDGQGRRVAVITDNAKQQVRQGDFGKEVLDEDQKETTEITVSKSEFENLIERIEAVENQNQALRERARELEENQEHLLEQVAVLRMYVETFRRTSSSNVTGVMEDVEEEALEKGDLDASMKKYAKERE
jgi:predicted transcriptional regulator